METTIEGLGFKSPFKQIEYGVYGDFIMIYLKPYSIYFRGTINPNRSTLKKKTLHSLM